MSELLDYISTWSVVKWIVLVLVAGFIGQFGRMTAEAVAARVRLRREKRKAGKETPASLVNTTETMPINPMKPADAPAAQAALRTNAVGPFEASAAKPPEAPEAASHNAVQATTAVETADKKALKAAQKTRKKTVKAAAKAAKK